MNNTEQIRSATPLYPTLSFKLNNPTLAAFLDMCNFLFHSPAFWLYIYSIVYNTYLP